MDELIGTLNPYLIELLELIPFGWAPEEVYNHSQKDNLEKFNRHYGGKTKYV